MERESPYDRLLAEMNGDPRVCEDVSVGRRVSFYRLSKDLGCGNFSRVKLGVHMLCHEKVAVKILDKFKLENKAQKLLAREIAILERLFHPNLIRVYEVCETISKLHIVTEYCSGGELQTRICREGRIPESDARPLFAQLIAAVGHLHDQQIIHRDIKAENVYFSSANTVKLGDFGFSTVSASTETLTTCCGSPPYAAPELFKDAPYVGTYVDIWALGVLLFYMVTGVMPFRAENVPKLKPIILSGRYLIPDSVSAACSAVINGLLRLSPRERTTVDRLRKSLWLLGTRFPNNWSRDQDAEQKARAVMTEQYGVPSDLVDRSVADVRNPIAGTYRVLLHQIERRAKGADCENAKDDGYHSYNSMSDIRHDAKSASSQSGKRSQISSKTKSSTCILL